MTPIKAVALMVLLGVAQAQIALPPRATMNLPQDMRAGMSSGATSAMIQQAASGRGDAHTATTMGGTATSMVNMGTGMIATSRDNQNQAIRTATQTAIGTAAGGGTPRVDPTRAAGAIQATQAMARGTQSTSTRQIDAQAATTAAIRSGNAEAATTTGAITTGIAGGSSIVNSVTMATATPGSVHAPPPALPPTGNRAVPAAAQRGGVTTTTGNRAATAPSGSRARASAPRTTTTTTTTTHNTAAHKGAATTTTAAHHASPKASPHMVTATQPGRAPAPAPKP